MGDRFRAFRDECRQEDLFQDHDLEDDAYEELAVHNQLEHMPSGGVRRFEELA